MSKKCKCIVFQDRQACEQWIQIVSDSLFVLFFTTYLMQILKYSPLNQIIAIQIFPFSIELHTRQKFGLLDSFLNLKFLKLNSGCIKTAF